MEISNEQMIKKHAELTLNKISRSHLLTDEANVFSPTIVELICELFCIIDNLENEIKELKKQHGKTKTKRN